MGIPLTSMVFCTKCGCAYSTAKWDKCPVDGTVENEIINW